jgi:hypothetical protein
MKTQAAAAEARATAAASSSDSGGGGLDDTAEHKRNKGTSFVKLTEKKITKFF